MDADLPAAMVEAAARALVEDADEHHSVFDTPTWDGMRPTYEARARAALAAALGVCHVDRYWAARPTRGVAHLHWSLSQNDATDGAEYLRRVAPADVSVDLVWRLDITTPAQPVTTDEQP